MSLTSDRPRPTDQRFENGQSRDELIAKQGNRDRPNPRHCPSDKLDNVMAAPILGFHQGQRSPTAPKAAIDDCKPKLRSAPLSPLAMQGASIDDNTPGLSHRPSRT